MKITQQTKNYCTEFKMTDKKSFKLCLCVLEKLWQQAIDAKQDPQIVLGMRRNDDEIFTITGKLEIEKQKRI